MSFMLIVSKERGLWFANFEVNLQKDGSKNRGISYGNRALFTKFAAGYDAKSRIELPNKLNFEWSSFMDAYQAALAPPKPQRVIKKLTPKEGAK